MTGTDGVHERVEIRAERERVTQVIVVLRVFAVLVRKRQERQTAVIEREDRSHTAAMRARSSTQK